MNTNIRKCEALREEILIREQTNNQKEEAEGRILVKNLANIKAFYLFATEEGIKVANRICLMMTSVGNLNANWPELGARLDLPILALQCIAKERFMINGHYASCSEMVLLLYACTETATVNNILQALIYLHRLDIVLDLLNSKYISDLANKVNSKYENSNYKDSCKINGIIPLSHKVLADQLPMPLNEYLKPEQYGFNPRNIPNEYLQKSEICQNSNQQEPFQYCKLVMLTFAEDGKLFAEELAKNLTRKKINNLPFGVVILQNHKNDIVSNAEEFIIHLFPQMDYVIPILTAGYFCALSDERFSSSNLLDERYIKFIHDLMNKYYTKNQCRNKKVRCIIPNKDIEIVHKNARFKNEPVLNSAWYSENNIEEFLITLIQS